MEQSLENLRRAAKILRKAHRTSEATAKLRVQQQMPRSRTDNLQHADYLHAIARENGFDSWPQLKLALEVPALHQVIRRLQTGKQVRQLLAAGMDATQLYQGMSAYAVARVFGNAEVAAVLAAAGGKTVLTDIETVFANAADGQVQDNVYVDVAKLPPLMRGIVADLLPYPDRLDHIKRLVALGVEYDFISNGTTPLHRAGWLGDPVALAYLISLSPDMGFISGHGGTLLSSIVDGCQNSLPRVGRDHIACARLALEHGVALPKWVIDMAGDTAMLAFLQDWASAHPGQVPED